MCVLIFCTTFVWNISHYEKNWARYDQKCTYIGLHVKYPLFLSDSNETWIFPTGFREILKYKSSINSPIVNRTVCCGQTDRQTGRQTCWSYSSLFAILRTCQKVVACKLFLLLLLALQPTVGFSLLSDFPPFCAFFTLLSPPSYS
jgi:hypothetical protein